MKGRRITVRFVDGFKAGTEESYQLTGNLDLAIGSGKGCTINFPKISYPTVPEGVLATIEIRLSGIKGYATFKPQALALSFSVNDVPVELEAPLIGNEMLTIGENGPKFQFISEPPLDLPSKLDDTPLPEVRTERREESTLRLALEFLLSRFNVYFFVILFVVLFGLVAVFQGSKILQYFADEKKTIDIQAGEGVSVDWLFKRKAETPVPLSPEQKSAEDARKLSSAVDEYLRQQEESQEGEP